MMALIACPGCDSPTAEYHTWELLECGALNAYSRTSCRECGHLSGDVDDCDIDDQSPAEVFERASMEWAARLEDRFDAVTILMSLSIDARAEYEKAELFDDAVRLDAAFDLARSCGDFCAGNGFAMPAMFADRPALIAGWKWGHTEVVYS